MQVVAHGLGALFLIASCAIAAREGDELTILGGSWPRGGMDRVA